MRSRGGLLSRCLRRQCSFERVIVVIMLIGGFGLDIVSAFRVWCTTRLADIGDLPCPWTDPPPP